MTRVRGAAACLAFVAGVLLATFDVVAKQVDANAVRNRLHAYLSDYERELSTLVAAERMTQWPHARPGTGTLDSTGIRRDTTRPRRLTADVAFVPLPGNPGWLGYRDVRTVDDRPVPRPGPPLEDLLRAGSDDARERAMALLLESARHNLGAPRTINLPTLPLELLHLRNQGRFVIIGTYRDRTGECDALRLDFEETVRPTIIRRPDGGDMPSRIAAWVVPATGRLCRAEVRTRDGQLGAWFEALVRVDFEWHATLGPWCRCDSTRCSSIRRETKPTAKPRTTTTAASRHPGASCRLRRARLIVSAPRLAPLPAPAPDGSPSRPCRRG